MGETATGLNVAGSLLNGMSQAQQHMFQASVADNNAKMLGREAQAALDSGYDKVSAMKIQTGQIKAGQKATQAGNGIDVGSKTAVAVREATQTEGDYNAFIEHYNTQRAAFAFMLQRQNMKSQASLDRMGAQGDIMGGLFGAGSSYISGAASTAAKKAEFDRVGLRY